MADIELVIKIPKRVYNYIRKYGHIANSDVLDIKDAIINGTPFPKGHWIPGGYDDNYYICDKCNYKASEYYFKPRYNFCPNCGAKMSEQEEE